MQLSAGMYTLHICVHLHVLRGKYCACARASMYACPSFSGGGMAHFHLKGEEQPNMVQMYRQGGAKKCIYIACALSNPILCFFIIKFDLCE